MDVKDRKLYYLKIFMSSVNFMILAYFSIITIVTIRNINRSFSARQFLENVTYLPEEPLRSSITVFVSFFLFLLIIEIRQEETANRFLSTGIYAMEIFLCLLIIKSLYVGYNGIILLMVADIVTTIRDKHNRILFLVIMGIMYIFSDYNLVSMQMKMVSFQEIISVYPARIHVLLIGIRNMLISLNILAFIVYMIILMRNQEKENERIALLNHQLKDANEQLQEMNLQLKEYAGIREKMGETKERNRIAREIHDTLGHTMTGLSAGIDACIAMIDYSVDGTKKQLDVISQVARQGIEDIRRSVNKLRPDALERYNLKEALENMVEEVMVVSDVHIDYRCEVSVMKFNADEEDMIYRVVQEGITNAIRHGKATEIDVHITQEEKGIVLSIQDNGTGCEEIKSGFGLIHIRERIQMLNGTVSYDGRNGFHILAKIPIRWSE